MLWATVATAEDAGTTSPFSFGAGSRELATGGAVMARPDGATAAYWNPAALAAASRISFTGQHVGLYESGVSYQYMGFAWPTLDYGTLGMGVFRLGVDGIERRDANNLLLGETEDSRLGFYLAYGRQMSGYQVGATITMETHSLDTYSSSSSPGLNLAVSRKLEFKSNKIRSLSLAVVGRNLIRPGFKLMETTVEYPMAAELGLSLELVPKSTWQHTVLLSAKMTKTDYVDPKFSLGLEYAAGSILSLRGGLRDGKPSVGLGLAYGGIDFDYALVDRDMGSLHLFTLSSSVGASVAEKRRQRELARETEFNSLMSDRLLAGKHQMVGDLVDKGRAAREAGELVGAVDLFDRALFMARSVGFDTTVVASEYYQIKDRLDEVERKHRFRLNLDSAMIRLQTKDYLGVRYFANLALEDVPTSAEAVRLVNQATAALEATSTHADRVTAQLAMADSLLSGGRVDQALKILTMLTDAEPGNDLVRMTHKRAMFEQLRNRTSRTFDAGNVRSASVSLDSAVALFPAHQWCLDMQRRIDAIASAPVVEESTVVATQPPPELSRELLRQVASTYSAAMEKFKAGRLPDAIVQWEQVERLAPNYKSVRRYLVNAYKFVGVEDYGKGNLQQAVEVWEKALKLDSHNAEIIDYLDRTRTEISRMREFSYGDQ